MQGNTLNVTLVNNILWVGGGYALSVDPNSQRTLTSDYNLFYTTGTGKLGQWENRDFTSRVDWYYEVGLDQHSRVADPLFANPAGADNILGYRAGGLSASFYNNITWTDPPVAGADRTALNSSGAAKAPCRARSTPTTSRSAGKEKCSSRRRAVHLLHAERRRRAALPGRQRR